MQFTETSAIRMSEALVATDARFMDEFLKSTRTRCPHGFIRGARDLAELLSLPQLLGLPGYSGHAQANDSAPDSILGKHGIICFLNIPEHSAQGHIDLWDNNMVVGKDFWDAESILMWELL